MAWFKRSSRFIILALAVALTLGLAVNVPAQVQAQLTPPSLSSQLPNQSNFRVPRTATEGPVNTQGGATRSDCIASDKSPAALVPASKMGETLAEYPTVSWYLPKTRASAVKFVLRDEKNHEVYSVQYSLAKYREKTGPRPDDYDSFVVGAPGIMSLTLPAATSLSPLKIGQVYQSDLTLICDAQESINISTNGGIKRIEPNPTLAARIEQATPEERVAIYAEQKLWYDAVATLVELGRSSPNDANLAATWDKLLKSEGL